MDIGIDSEVSLGIERVVTLKSSERKHDDIYTVHKCEVQCCSLFWGYTLALATHGLRTSNCEVSCGVKRTVVPRSINKAVETVLFNGK